MLKFIFLGFFEKLEDLSPLDKAHPLQFTTTPMQHFSFPSLICYLPGLCRYLTMYACVSMFMSTKGLETPGIKEHL